MASWLLALLLGCRDAPSPAVDAQVPSAPVPATDPNAPIAVDAAPWKQQALCESARSRPRETTFIKLAHDLAPRDRQGAPWATFFRANHLLAETRCDGLSLVELFIRQGDARLAYRMISRSDYVASFSPGEPPLVTLLHEELAEKADDPPERAKLRACLKLHLEHHLSEGRFGRASELARAACAAAGYPDVFAKETTIPLEDTP